MALEKAKSSSSRIVINLIGDERFTQVIRRAMEEICGRYKRFPSMPELLNDAIQYASQFSGSELADTTRDHYLYEPRKQGAVNLTPAMYQRLTELVASLNATPPVGGEGRWTRRKLGVAALFAYCQHVIQNRGQRQADGLTHGD